jgi:hypothetical protein
VGRRSVTGWGLGAAIALLAAGTFLLTTRPRAAVDSTTRPPPSAPTPPSLEGAAAPAPVRDRAASPDGEEAPGSDEGSATPTVPNEAPAATEEAVADPRDAQREASQRDLDERIAKYRTLPPGDERTALLKETTLPHHLYVQAGGDLRYVSFFREVLEGSPTDEERRMAVIALTGLRADDDPGLATDALVAAVEDSRAPRSVRFQAAQALVWAVGPSADRARRRLYDALDDDDPEVRSIVSIAMGVVVKDEEARRRLLLRFGREEDANVLESIALAVLHADPQGGEESLRRSRRDEAGVAVITNAVASVRKKESASR